MGKVIAKRFIFMIPVVLAVTFIIFMLSFISAGDAARVLAEQKYEHPSPEQVEEVRHEEGLDQPVLVQYGKWLNQALHGDFGKSYSTRKPAFEELKRYFPQTFKLAVTSFFLLLILLGFCQRFMKTGFWIKPFVSYHRSVYLCHLSGLV